MNMPTDAEERKRRPVLSGVLNYFPDAILAVSEVSLVGNEQHHPGTPLHWDRSKSTDEADALVRHLMEAGNLDTDGIRHTAKVAWRALALLQKEIEQEQIATVSIAEAQKAFISPSTIGLGTKIIHTTGLQTK
jgi:Domain of unknown function (DUF5664)